LTEVEQQLVLVDDPDDLVPPPLPADRGRSLTRAPQS